MTTTETTTKLSQIKLRDFELETRLRSSVSNSNKTKNTGLEKKIGSKIFFGVEKKLASIKRFESTNFWFRNFLWVLKYFGLENLRVRNFFRGSLVWVGVPIVFSSGLISVAFLVLRLKPGVSTGV